MLKFVSKCSLTLIWYGNFFTKTDLIPPLVFFFALKCGLKNLFFFLSADHTWSEAALKKAQVMYLLAKMFRTNEQCDQLRNSEQSRQNAEDRAKRLLVIEEDHAKREQEMHTKKMKLLDVKMHYWECKLNAEFANES